MTRKDNEITNDQESISYVLITQEEISKMPTEDLLNYINNNPAA